MRECVYMNVYIYACCVCALCVCTCKCAYVHVHVLYAKQNQPGAVEKGVAKQSRIKSIMWHLRWVVTVLVRIQRIKIIIHMYSINDINRIHTHVILGLLQS